MQWNKEKECFTNAEQGWKAEKNPTQQSQE